MIDANHWGILFITAAPWIGAVIVGGLGGFVLVVRGIFAKQTALQRATFLSRLPFWETCIAAIKLVILH